MTGFSPVDPAGSSNSNLFKWQGNTEIKGYGSAKTGSVKRKTENHNKDSRLSNVSCQISWSEKSVRSQAAQWVWDGQMSEANVSRCRTGSFNPYIKVHDGLEGQKCALHPSDPNEVNSPLDCLYFSQTPYITSTKSGSGKSSMDSPSFMWTYRQKQYVPGLIIFE